jgi:hypothetical protein
MGKMFSKQVAMQRVLLLALVVAIWLPSAAFAQLAAEYRRNGECYLMIGEGPASMRGIYRLNNPEKEKTYTPPNYLFRPSNSFGFAVDLLRNIYTFSEEISPGFRLLSNKLKRQVLDSVSANHADWGYHAYLHYDHRGWGRGSNLYRVGPPGRDIVGNARNVSRTIRSNGPGRAIPTPAGNPLPKITGATALGVYPGRQWYEIPNGSWYSSWYARRAVGRYRTFYQVCGDKEEGQPHYWKLYTWTPNNINADRPSYRRTTGATVATSYDKRINRQVFAGCLDGCGGSHGSGSAVAEPMYNDVAFMPPIKGNPSRTYFYSRPQTNSNYEITLNNSNYNPGSSNPLIGLPQNLDTKWIGVSMRNATTDFVYALGNSVIEQWYRQVTGSSARMNISAVAVSNQWNQKGGVVYAYDKTDKIIYKFVRWERDGTPVSNERFQFFPMQDILAKIGAVSSSEIDDIKADGFGSLYFALSHPSKSIYLYDPTEHFELNDAIHLEIDPPAPGSTEDPTAFLVFRQDYGKAVFQRDIYDGKIEEIGKKNYAEIYYNVAIRAPKACLDELIAAGPFPHNQVARILASYPTEIGNNDGTIDKRDFSRGSRGVFFDIIGSDPGKCQLSVINVPTPPKVHSLGNKKSYLDIIGPYVGGIPMANENDMHTNQSQYYSPVNDYKHSLDTLYFYMVENYPLPEGAQNPNEQPDWDGDGKKGGFITSMVDPKSSKENGRVFYHWQLWLVEDRDGKTISPPKLSPDDWTITPYPGKTQHGYVTFFYSPVRSKYILTCRVVYDWYDYDRLRFGDTIDDLPNVLLTNEKARPALPGSLNTYTAAAQRNFFLGLKVPVYDKDGKKVTPLKYENFVPATYSSALTTIIPDDSFCAIPIQAVGPKIGTGTTIRIAEVERCDEEDNPKTPSNWFSLAKASQQSKDDRPAEYKGKFHGIQAGKTYHWRMSLASQTILFDQISKVNSPSQNKCNFVIKELLDKDGPLFANSKEGLEFKNNDGEVRWYDDYIQVTAYLDYKVPADKNGNVETKRMVLTTDESGTEKILAKKSANYPIYATVSGGLPPTDPFIGELTIKMSRKFSYDVWMKRPTSTGDIIYKKFFMPEIRSLDIEAKTKVMVIDRQAPKIIYAETSPNQLFGITGQALSTSTKGPNGKKNPSDIYFTLTDNSPWEAISKIEGINDKDKWDRNNKYNIKVSQKPSPKAAYNFCPLFAKGINRNVQISFESLDLKKEHYQIKTITESLTGKRKQYVNWIRPAKVRADLPFGATYIHGFYYDNDDPNKFRETTNTYLSNPPSGNEYYKILSNGAASYFATMRFKLPLSSIFIGTKPNPNAPLDVTQRIPTNIIPKGYANNTPGYLNEKTGEISPYKFFLQGSDSSGNKMFVRLAEGGSSNDIPLNLVLHVKDNIPPIPLGYIINRKDNSITTFPVRDKDGIKKMTVEELKKQNSGNGYKFLTANDQKTMNDNRYLYEVGLDTLNRSIDKTSFAEEFIDHDISWESGDTNSGFINNKANYFQALKPVTQIENLGKKKLPYLKNQINNNIPPAFLEDNIEFELGAGGSDNAGIAHSKFTLKLLDTNGNPYELTPPENDKWEEREVNTVGGKEELLDASIVRRIGAARGRPEDFPMALPLQIVAEDNAREWDYYDFAKPGSKSDANDDWSEWTWGTPKMGNAKPNKRTFKTTVPVYGSKLRIRTLDKGIRSK